MKRLKIYLFLLIILFLQVFVLSAQETVLMVNNKLDKPSISLTLKNYPGDILISSIQNGLRAEISFEIKAYATSNGIMRIFGDRLYSEENPVYTGRWDRFSDEFVIEYGDIKNTFKDKELFLASFFTLEDYYSTEIDFKSENLYLLGRIIIKKVKLVPPMNLLSRLLGANTYTTPWIKYYLSDLDNSQ